MASTVTIGADVIVDDVKLTGGRPLDQIKALQRHDFEIYQTYSYIRCLHYQVGKYFGDKADSERQKVFSLDLSVLSNRVQHHRFNIDQKTGALKRHARISDGAKISFTEQIDINRFKSELKDFRTAILAEALTDIPKDMLLIENIATCENILDH